MNIALTAIERPEPTPLHRRLVLVGCGKSKRSGACEARELYTGNLFAAARDYARHSGAPWFILSAKHGLLDPTAELEPYNETLPSGGERARRWGDQVGNALAARFPGEKLELEVLAGVKYVEPLLVQALGPRAWSVRQPLKGLEIGERLAWFAARRAERPAPDMEKIQAEVDAWLQPRLEAARKRQVEHVSAARRRRIAAGVWVATPCARVPAWVRDLTGLQQLSQIVVKFGAGARFERAFPTPRPVPRQAAPVQLALFMIVPNSRRP